MRVFTVTLGNVVEHTTIVAENRGDAMDFFFKEFADLIYDESNMIGQESESFLRSVLLVEVAEKDWDYLSDIKVFIEDDDVLEIKYNFTPKEIENGAMPTGLQVFEQGYAINKMAGDKELPVLVCSEFYS